MRGHLYTFVRNTMEVYMTNIIRDSLQMTLNAKRKTVFAADVHRALARNNRMLYGTMDPGIKRTKNKAIGSISWGGLSVLRLPGFATFQHAH